jgi:phosphate transport system substrate-binding protein
MRIGAGLVVALCLALAEPGLAGVRDYIFVVGSSTVYPFASVVAERFGGRTGARTPMVEQIGSGGGIKMFCAGLGVLTPDIVTASRRMTRSEIEQCAANGVDQIVELVIGFDGIVLANAKGGPHYDFSLRDLYLGLAQEVPDPEGSQTPVANPYETWAAVSPGLENMPIAVYGPSPVHGTYDAFLELAMEGGCKAFPWIAALAVEDRDRFRAICRRLRDDGAYVEVSGDYDLVVRKLRGNPPAVGVVGFNYLDQNRDFIQAASIEGVEPTLQSIVDGDYGLTRALYLYVKKQHVGAIVGLQAFVAAFASDATAGNDGYLEDRGLIPLAGPQHRQMQEVAETMPTLQASDLD